MQNHNILALDVGDKRVGMAMSRSDVRVPVVLPTLDRNEQDFWEQITQAAKQYEINEIVIGLPRGLEGQDTSQTKAAKEFAEELSRHIDLPQRWQDEALTSVKAESILNSSGKPFAKSDIDSLAATFILSDYLESKTGKL